MNKLNVYLSGATLKVDAEFQDWRTECFSFQLMGYYENINFINPIAHFNYTYSKPKTDKQCIDLFMWLVEKSDVLLVNLDCSDSSIGTSMEVEHAYCNNIPIIGFGKKDTTWYNWTKERCSVIFNSLEDAVRYISNDYGDINC
jgi:nucleoside 2-deoxyribosyltransferase